MEIIDDDGKGYFKILIPFEKIDRNLNIFSGKAFKCEHCSKIFFNEVSFKIHKKYHKGEKLFPCTQESCFRSFNSKKNLELHVNTFHNKEKIHQDILAKCKEVNKKLETSTLTNNKKNSQWKDYFNNKFNYEYEKDDEDNISVYQVNGKQKLLLGIKTSGLPMQG